MDLFSEAYFIYSFYSETAFFCILFVSSSYFFPIGFILSLLKDGLLLKLPFNKNDFMSLLYPLSLRFLLKIVVVGVLVIIIVLSTPLLLLAKFLSDV